MCQLCYRNHTTLYLSDFDILCVVLLHQVVHGEKVRNLLTLRSWQPLNFLTKGDAGALKELGKKRIALPSASLPQERILVGSLVSKDQDVHCAGTARLSYTVKNNEVDGSRRGIERDD
jgi:hypothetical protein